MILQRRNFWRFIEASALQIRIGPRNGVELAKARLMSVYEDYSRCQFSSSAVMFATVSPSTRALLLVIFNRQRLQARCRAALQAQSNR